MKPKTTEDIFKLLDGYVLSSSLGTAMELGLFWFLDGNPQSAAEVASLLDMPLNRCHLWLQVLCRIGLLEENRAVYVLTDTARKTILNAYSRDTWAFMAHEERSRFPSVQDMPLRMCRPQSIREARHVEAPDYFSQLREDPTCAAGFTRMLGEIHVQLAEQLARMLDLRRVGRMMDLGGGSGVVSFALLRRHPGLTCVVVDVESVCQAGRQIAAGKGFEERITYLPVNFLQDDLPGGFDLVLFCDGGPYSESLLRRIHASLNQDGQLVIVDQFAHSEDHPSSNHLIWAFLTALDRPSPTMQFTTIGVVQERMRQAGFHNLYSDPVSCKDHLRWNSDWIALGAHK